MKQQGSLNISAVIFYIFEWFYAFNKKEMSYEERVGRITKLLQAVEEEEETLGGENSESEDELEICDYQSGTEQSGDESEDGVSEDDLPLYDRLLCTIVGKDGTSKWKTIPPRQNSRTRIHNIVTHLPGVKSVAKHATTPIEAWETFFTEEMLQLIVEYTNLEIQRIRGNYSRERNANLTNIVELKALIGLLFLAGLLRSSHVNTANLWATDGTGTEIFPCVLSEQRFKFLLRCLRFDNKSDRKERKKTDRLAPIREIFEMFVKNCRNNYSISEYFTIDESLVPFRGRCPFRQFMRNKPAKYGIKVFCVVDSRMFYTSQMEIYAGKQPEGPYKLSNSPADVVKRLIQPISHTGRNVTFDNWFTSVTLAEEILKEHKITIVGTIRKNKREIPPEFINTKEREEKSSKFAFRDGTLVSYIPKKGKVVLALSTMHHNNDIDAGTGHAQKPEIITFYNATKGGVDTVDEMCGTYSVARKSNRWPLTLFYFLLNVSGINSQIIFQANTDSQHIRRDYLKLLSLDLVRRHMQYRSTLETFPVQLKERIRKFTGVPEEIQEEIQEPPQKKRKRCEACPRNMDRKTQLSCVKCKKQVCKDHSAVVCKLCIS